MYLSDIENDVTGGMTLKIRSAVKIILDNDGSVPVVFCGLSHWAFRSICIDGKYEEVNGYTLIKQN